MKFILINVVCDTGISIPTKLPTNQPKNSLYECYVCNVPCNSEFMYEQHVQGAKHRKKVSLREVNTLFTWVFLMRIKIVEQISMTLFIFKVRNMAKLEDLKAGGDGTGNASTKAASILER